MSESTFAGETSGGMEPPKIIKPQQGPQTIFLASRADIAIYGGAAGGGKSHALLMQPLRHIRNGGFGAVIFRRTNPQIMAEGGLWDQSHELYRYVGGRPLYGQSKQWIFKSGAKITFSHMDHEDDKHNWDSSQIPLIEFDEVTSFTESQFVYMFSRNRSTCGVKPYIRAACNPDSDSWLAKWIEWWIDQDTGYPILERSGVVRWFVRDGDGMVWFGSKAEAVEWLVDKKSMARALAEKVPKSFTFVPANLDDNKILDQVNPEYRANLMAMPDVERERLLRGNWKIRPAAGLKFPRDKWKLFDEAPTEMRYVRFWDRAYTEGGKGARTAGVLMGELIDHDKRNPRLPRYWIIHVVADRWGDADRESQMKFWAEMDRAKYGHVTIGIEREGGAGKHSANVSVNNLSGSDGEEAPAMVATCRAAADPQRGDREGRLGLDWHGSRARRPGRRRGTRQKQAQRHCGRSSRRVQVPHIGSLVGCWRPDRLGREHRRGKPPAHAAGHRGATRLLPRASRGVEQPRRAGRQCRMAGLTLRRVAEQVQ
jgi:hypothetical protein